MSNFNVGDLVIAEVDRGHKGIEAGGVYMVQRVATHGNSIEIGEQWHPTYAFGMYRPANWKGVNGVTPQASDKGRLFRFASTHRADKVGMVFTLVAPPIKWSTGGGDYARPFDCAWVNDDGELFTFADDDRIEFV